MKREDKELLLKDLCARLPYGVKIDVTYSKDSGSSLRARLCSEGINILDTNILWLFQQGEIYIKPYLFPLSSMTKEQEEELITITNGKFRYMCGDINNIIPRKNISEWGISENAYINSIKVINILYTWLLKNHFDINGLIPMGLAI